jgi:SAM-dependent methyltransferase
LKSEISNLKSSEAVAQPLLLALSPAAGAARFSPNLRDNLPVHSYTVSAKYYDSAYAVKSNLLDLPFYLALAKKSPGPVLELGCGTGRILLPIARAGIPIHGLDGSAAMLKVLKSRIAADPPEVRKRVRLHKGDMRRTQLGRKFPLVLMPFRPLQHMHTVPDQLAALRTAAAHLDRRGMFAFDVFYPKFEMISGGIGVETPELEWPVPGNPGKIVRRFFRKDRVDKIHQVFEGTFIFRTYEGDRLIREETEPLRMSYFTYPHLRALFLMAGLEPVAEYGAFDNRPLDNSSDQMIFLLRRAARNLS